VVEHLPINCEALSSNLNITEKSFYIIESNNKHSSQKQEMKGENLNKRMMAMQ
jgi:hypothetical protein